jgi:hypothetical protein
MAFLNDMMKKTRRHFHYTCKKYAMIFKHESQLSSLTVIVNTAKLEYNKREYNEFMDITNLYFKPLQINC